MAVRTPPAAFFHWRSIVVQNRAEAAVLGEQRIAAVAEQVQVERLVGLLLAVALDFDGDGLRRLAGSEGQRAGHNHQANGLRFFVKSGRPMSHE